MRIILPLLGMFIEILITLAIIGIIFLIIYISRDKKYTDKNTIKGKQGEYETLKTIHNIIPDAKIITNAYIPCKNGYTEIDIIVIAVQAIYVIENKNYSGWIYGKEDDQYWTETFPNKKYRFYNPIKQNNTHIFYLKNVLLKHNFPCAHVKSLICFNNRATLKKIISRTPVICTKDLRFHMNSNEKNYTQRDVERIYTLLKSFTQNTEKIKKEHIEKIKNNKQHNF